MNGPDIHAALDKSARAWRFDGSFLFGAGLMTSGGDSLAPTVTSTTVGANGTTVTIVFSEAVTGEESLFLAPTVGDTISLVYASGDGTNTLVFTASATVYADQVFTLSYSTGDPLPIEDLNGNLLAEFTGAAVTNDSEVTVYDLAGIFTAGDITALRASNSLFSDAGTTVVTAEDATVFQANTTVGGLNFACVNAGERSLLKSNGARWFLRFDGVDDFLRVTHSTAGTVLYTAMRLTTSAAATALRRYVSIYRNAGNDFDEVTSCIPMITSDLTTTNGLCAFPAAFLAARTTVSDTLCTLESIITGGNSILSLNGSDSGTVATAMNLGADRIQLAAGWAAGALGGPVDTDIYKWIACTTIPDANGRAAVRAWLEAV